MGKTLCISYSRFSSSKQSQGTSLQRQLENHKKYAEEQGWILDNKLCFQDEGISGYTGENLEKGKLGKLVSMIEGGEIPKGTVLLIESLDRLSRENVYDAFGLLQKIISSGVRVITYVDRVEYNKENISGDDGKIFILIGILLRGNNESKTKSFRSLDNWDKKRKNSSIKKLTNKCPAWLELRDDKLEFNCIPERTELIQRIFDLSYSGIGIKSITRLFNSENIPAWQSKNGWHSSYIYKILTNHAVIGEFQPHILIPGTKKRKPEGKPVQNYFPKMVSVEVFNAVQGRLRNGTGTHIGGKTGKVTNLFGGIAKCGYCGATIQIVDKGKPPKGGKYLVCDNARRAIRCIYKSFRYDEVEDAFLDFCSNEINICEILKEEFSSEDLQLKSLHFKLSQKQGELNNVNARLTDIKLKISESSNDLTIEYLDAIVPDLVDKNKIISEEIIKCQFSINEITANRRDVNNRIATINMLKSKCKDSENEIDKISYRTLLRNEIRQIIKEIILFPIGLYCNDEEIEQEITKFDKQINDSPESMKDSIRQIRDFEINNLRSASKDNRFFVIVFKNGNYRHIHYNKKDGTYRVTSERIGNDRWMLGKKMNVIIEDENAELNAAIEHLKRTNTEFKGTPDEIEKLREWLSEANLAYDDEQPPLV